MSHFFLEHVKDKRQIDQGGAIPSGNPPGALPYVFYSHWATLIYAAQTSIPVSWLLDSGRRWLACLHGRSFTQYAYFILLNVLPSITQSTRMTYLMISKDLSPDRSSDSILQQF